MEFKTLILSHGNFCEEIIKSAEMIVGKNDSLYAVPLLTQDDLESYSLKVKNIIESFNDEPFLIIVDVMGGTPFNCAMSFLKDYNFSIVTGLCLPMLLEVGLMDADSIKEVGEKLLEISKNAGYLFDNDSLKSKD